MSDKEKEILAYFEEHGYPHFKTGSSEVCDPPVTDTDVDWVVLIDPGVGTHKLMLDTGLYTQHNDIYDDGTSLRSGNVNVIVVNTWPRFAKWRFATAAVKQLNLLDKKERIAVFSALRDDNWKSKELWPLVNRIVNWPRPVPKIVPVEEGTR